MNQQKQMQLVLLFTLNELGGGGHRRHVLQYINDSCYWFKNDQNDKIRSSRNENVWRNNFSYERQHLKQFGYMKNCTDGTWEITEDGKNQLALMVEEAKKLKLDAHICFTPVFFQKIFSVQISAEAEQEQCLIEHISQTGNNSADKLIYLSNEPQPIGAILNPSRQHRNYLRSYSVSIQSLRRAGHLCEIEPTHRSFLRRNSTALYMEPHHMIPMSFTDYFGVNLDREQNVFSLCSNCHNQIHYGLREDVRWMVSKLFLSREFEINSIIGRHIDIEELYWIYGVL
ncbi:winged helix-turn-helix domain-containing protein [Lacrimispora sp.]|jgi:5-methylcytosine-specific restriction endonuclease McrA|uniref:winged helix-turn-helix domain-containing protein n=1 Tax=Lacrimispora sp. TaxID=2719234 RepID=UPI0028AF9227|nr:winged helix-turn-helix domain-containing protein [Lacrimispora sp.]